MSIRNRGETSLRLRSVVGIPAQARPARASGASEQPARLFGRRRLARLAGVCLLALGGCAIVSVGVANAASATNAKRLPGKLHLRKRALGTGSPTTRPRWACPEGVCQAIVAPRPVRRADRFVLPQGHRRLEGSGERGGLDPQDLRSAYKLPISGGSTQTIALIDAFGYPGAESDLAAYRSRYGLPACTKSNGCFEKVNEQGEQGNYPPAEPGWDGEAALDEDMASAACPECHILLVEGSGEFPADLGASVNTAAELGATEISNSYGYPERLTEFCGTEGCSQFNADYSHPGVLILASAGDAGFDDTYFGEGLQTEFPAASPNVVAVGGTALHRDAASARGWKEEVWNEPGLLIGTGSGCTDSEAKPSWQTDTGCAHRTDDDIAAVAAVETGVSVRIEGQWEVYGGTSVSSPLLAGIEAHASATVRSLGAQFFYENPSSVFDVTEGFNWDPRSKASECAPQEYLCNGELGYDGPTGVGTPAGVPGLGETPEAPAVASLSPKRGPTTGATLVTITGSGFTDAINVAFGGNPAPHFTVDSPSSITAESPTGSPGTVNVTVTTGGGTSTLNKKDRFKYKRAKK
jgi:IPT/TIG domain/Subtilase family